MCRNCYSILYFFIYLCVFIFVRLILLSVTPTTNQKHHKSCSFCNHWLKNELSTIYVYLYNPIWDFLLFLSYIGYLSQFFSLFLLCFFFSFSSYIFTSFLFRFTFHYLNFIIIDYSQLILLILHLPNLWSQFSVSKSLTSFEYL